MNPRTNLHMVHEGLFNRRRPRKGQKKGQKKGHPYQEVDTTLMEILSEMVMAVLVLVLERFVSPTAQTTNTRTTKTQMQLTHIENENLLQRPNSHSSLQRLPLHLLLDLVLLRMILKEFKDQPTETEISSLEPIMESRMMTFTKMLRLPTPMGNIK